MLPKGISAASFPAGIPLEKAARLAREAGFAVFEPVLTPGGEGLVITTETQARQMGDILQSAGLQTPIVSCPLPSDGLLTASEPECQTKARKTILAGLDRARWLGAKALVVPIGPIGTLEVSTAVRVGYAGAINAAFDLLSDLSFEAEAHGVVLAIEHTPSPFLISPAETRDFLDELNSPWLAMVLDLPVVARYGLVADWIDTVGPHLVGLHIGKSIGNSPWDTDREGILAALKRRRFAGPVIYVDTGEPEEISRFLDEVFASL